jgi:hypothetical protein
MVEVSEVAVAVEGFAVVVAEHPSAIGEKELSHTESVVNSAREREGAGEVTAHSHDSGRGEAFKFASLNEKREEFEFGSGELSVVVERFGSKGPPGEGNGRFDVVAATQEVDGFGGEIDRRAVIPGAVRTVRSSPEVIEVVIAVVVRLVCGSVTHGVLRPGWWVMWLVMGWRTLRSELKVTVTSWRSGAAT